MPIIDIHILRWRWSYYYYMEQTDKTEKKYMYIYRIYNCTDNMHLFPLHKGDMKICSLEKSHISRWQSPREIWLFRGWTNFHISRMQGKWMFYSTRPMLWWILPNEIFWPSLFSKLLFRNISGVIFTKIPLYDQSVKSWKFRIREIRCWWEGNTMLWQMSRGIVSTNRISI